LRAHIVSVTSAIALAYLFLDPICKFFSVAGANFWDDITPRNYVTRGVQQDTSKTSIYAFPAVWTNFTYSNSLHGPSSDLISSATLKSSMLTMTMMMLEDETTKLKLPK